MEKSIVIIFVLCIVKNSLSQPYANDYPYQKYSFNREAQQADTDGIRYLKNNLRDQSGLKKANTDTSLSYFLDSDKKNHDLHQLKRGGSTDNLTQVQGEDFETDKSHKRKHVKSGFQNSYHKDENGSKSSYYEDSDDVGAKTIYDKRHGTKGDQHDTEFKEGLRNDLSKNKYDDRQTGYDNRDLVDRHQSYVEDQGKQHGYADNYKSGRDDRLEIVRRPYSDYRSQHPPRHLDDRHFDDGYDRYNGRQHFDQGFNGRIASPIDHRDQLYNRDPIALPSRDFQTRRKITIFEDPRDDFIDPKVDRFHDNGNYMARSEVTRRYDYGPANDRTPMRLRYRGI